jgi:hypothetical protein
MGEHDMSKYKDYLLEQEAQGQDVFVEYDSAQEESPPDDEPRLVLGTDLDMYGDFTLDDWF